MNFTLDFKAMDFLKVLGARIRKLREDRGYTREVLAEAVGIDPSSIYRIENGMAQVKSTNLQKLAKALGVTADHLMQSSGEPVAPVGSGEYEMLKKLCDSQAEQINLLKEKLEQIKQMALKSASLVNIAAITKIPQDILELLETADERTIDAIRQILILARPQTDSKAKS